MNLKPDRSYALKLIAPAGLTVLLVFVGLLLPAVSGSAQVENSVTVHVVDGTTGQQVDAGIPVTAIVLVDGLEIARWSSLTDAEGAVRVSTPSRGQMTLVVSATYEGTVYSEQFAVTGSEPIELAVYQVAQGEQMDITERVALVIQRGETAGQLSVGQFVRFENSEARSAIFGEGELRIPVPETMFDLQVDSDLTLNTPFGLLDEQGRSLGLEPQVNRPRHVTLETFVPPGNGTVVLGYLIAAPADTVTLEYHLVRPVAEFQVLVPTDSNLDIGATQPQQVNIDGVDYRQRSFGVRDADSVVSVTVSGIQPRVDRGFFTGTTTLLIAIAAFAVPTLGAIVYAVLYKPKKATRL